MKSFALMLVSLAALTPLGCGSGGAADPHTPPGRPKRLVEIREELVVRKGKKDSFPEPVISGTVTSVLSGDTMIVETADRLYKVSLLAVLVPKEEKFASAFEASKKTLSDKALHQVVTVAWGLFDSRSGCRGIVWVGKRCINHEMVREGFAGYYPGRRVDWDRPESRSETDFYILIDRTQTVASETKSGLWAGGKGIPPWNIFAEDEGWTLANSKMPFFCKVLMVLGGSVLIGIVGGGLLAGFFFGQSEQATAFCMIAVAILSSAMGIINLNVIAGEKLGDNTILAMCICVLAVVVFVVVVFFLSAAIEEEKLSQYLNSHPEAKKSFLRKGLRAMRAWYEKRSLR